MKKLLLLVVLMFFAEAAFAIAVYVDGERGSDRHKGTRERPFRTIEKAAAFVEDTRRPESVMIKIAPGIYVLDDEIVFSGPEDHTRDMSLRIEAYSLPGDVGWKLRDMPVIMSAQLPGRRHRGMTRTYGFKIERSNVTIRGLKFMGNPLVNNAHYCIARMKEGLDGLAIIQCMFVGGKDSLSIYYGIAASGNKFVVDHCVFSGCYTAVRFRDDPDGGKSMGCAMKNCIIDNSHIAAVRTDQTADDFVFRNNIVTSGEYFWMREEGDTTKYRIENSIVAGNKYYSGYRTARWTTEQTGAEVTFIEKNIVKDVQVVIEKNKRSINYLHVAEGTAGRELNAGLFLTPKKDLPEKKIYRHGKKDAE